MQMQMHKLIADHAVLTELWAYWCGKRRAAAAPRRSDIVPGEIPRLLPHLLIIERDAFGAFRCCRVGDAASAGAAAPAGAKAGRPLSEMLPPAPLATASRHFAMAWTSGRPLCARNKDTAGGGVERIVTRVVLPLVDREGRVEALLCGQVSECRLRIHTGLWLRGQLESAMEQIGLLDAPVAAQAHSDWRRAA